LKSNPYSIACFALVILFVFGLSLQFPQGGITGAAVPGCLAHPPSLVSWWDADGSTVDREGLVINGVVGEVSFTEGKDGYAFSFGKGFIDAQPLGFPFEDRPRTVDFWIKRNSVQEGNRFVVYYGKSFTQQGFALGITPGGKVVFTDIGRGLYSKGIVALNEWTHVALVYSGKGEYDFYLNGYPDSHQTLDQPYLDTRVLELRLGSALLDKHQIDADVDEIEVFDRALRPEEIRHLVEYTRCKEDLDNRNVYIA